MENRYLSTSGLSMSQSQSISNQLNQRAIDINFKLSAINNCKKVMKFNDESILIQSNNRIDDETVLSLLQEKGTVSACQAWLMEAIKEKNNLLEKVKSEIFEFDEELPALLKSNYYSTEPNVYEDYGWNCLSETEMSDFIYCEAMASHYGQFFHKNGKLDVLRKEMNDSSLIEWMIVDKVSRLVTLERTSSSEDLLILHNKLVEIHREFEQKVNYYKAKVKNLTSDRNIQIDELNRDMMKDVQAKNDILRENYKKEHSDYNAKKDLAFNEFSTNLTKETKKVSKLKIKIPSLFQNTIDKYINKNTDGE